MLLRNIQCGGVFEGLGVFSLKLLAFQGLGPDGSIGVPLKGSISKGSIRDP